MAISRDPIFLLQEILAPILRCVNMGGQINCHFYFQLVVNPYTWAPGFKARLLPSPVQRLPRDSLIKKINIPDGAYQYNIQRNVAAPYS